MAFEVLRSRAADRDLELIFDHLGETYQALGDTVADAVERAVVRLRAMEDAMEALGAAPFQGALRPEFFDGLRQTTKDRAVIYFVIDEAAGQVRVLAVFFGGQDHLARMLRRIARS